MVDPECEYVSEFYRPVRGDLILNPVDERCPVLVAVAGVERAILPG